MKKLQLKRTIIADTDNMYVVNYQLLHNDEVIYENVVKTTKTDLFGNVTSIKDVDAFAIKQLQMQIEIV